MLYLNSVILGGAGAWTISRWGRSLGVLDRANHRSSHDGVVPKGGGIGILAAFLVASWILGLPTIFWVCVALTSLLSFYGDRREIPPRIRLSLQFLGSVGLLVGLFYWEGRSYWLYLMLPFLSVYVVGTANYYNFMDGIDGIAGITGVVGFGLVAVFAGLVGGKAAYVVLSVCFCVGSFNGFGCVKQAGQKRREEIINQ